MLHPYLDTPVEEDLMDLIDPDSAYPIETFALAGRILYLAIERGEANDDVAYEAALLKSVTMAEGEWSIA